MASKPIRVSASQLKDFDRCERSWFLSAVARAPDDAAAGGQYLLQGDLFDEAVQRYSARMDVDVADLVGAVRAKPGLRGAALTLPAEKWLELAERAQRMLRAVTPFLPAPKTAQVQHRYYVPVPGHADPPVVITGACDLRQLGTVWDTKSTTDRGPGKGRDRDTPPYALTAETLATDPQALLYAWCEFATDPLLATVECRWVYCSKPAAGSPAAWVVSVVFRRPDVFAWFEAYVRPRIARMLALHAESEIVLAPENARANHDGCARCFRRSSCNPFTGAQARLQPGAVTMAIDFAALRARQAGAKPAPVALPVVSADDALVQQLSASLVAEAAAVAHAVDDRRADLVAVNRPGAPDRTPPAAVVVVDTVGVDAAEATPEPPKAEPAPAAEPKRGRGRPRGAGGAKAVGVVQEAAPAAGALATDAEHLEALATRAQTIADAADSLVSELNGLLRARGVRV